MVRVASGHAARSSLICMGGRTQDDRQLANLGIARSQFCGIDGDLCQVGVENVNADFATFIRTIVILLALAAILFGLGEFQTLGSISGRSYLFLVLSGLATGASWVCYFRALKLGNASQVAPIDKMSVVLVAIFGVTFLGERLTAANWLGILLIAAGAFFVSGGPAPGRAGAA